MKIKHALMFVTVIISVILYSGCRRSTPHDFFLPDPGCGKLGYSGSDTHYNGGNYIYSTMATLSSQKTITSLSVGIEYSNEVYIMLYDTSNAMIVQVGPVSVVTGWNKFAITPIVLPAGNYRLAAQARYTGSGIRLHSGAGTVYWTSHSWGPPPGTFPGINGVLDSVGSWGMLMYGIYCD